MVSRPCWMRQTTMGSGSKWHRVRRWNGWCHISSDWGSSIGSRRYRHARPTSVAIPFVPNLLRTSTSWRCERSVPDVGRTVALEDSPNGLAAARAAGLRCVAVPGPITTDLDFADADLEVASIGDLSLPLLAALCAPRPAEVEPTA